jgi:hypothetical protein
LHNSKQKIIAFIFIILILFVYLYTHYVKDDVDFCLDTSICKEGFEINTEYRKILVNKDNCLKYNWKWIEEGHYCNMK